MRIAFKDCSDDLLPGCASFDDCGTCVGGTSGNTYNQEADCLGECFGSADYDTCDVCAGDNSSCNQPIAYYQTVNIDEDSGTTTITLEATDPNGDELLYFTSDPENGILLNLSGDSSEVIYTPNVDFNGQDSFTFTVTDGEWTSGIGVVTINVNPVNDSPILDFIEDQTIDEDNVFIFDILATDVDLDGLSFEIAPDE